jgi:hypothetical protein
MRNLKLISMALAVSALAACGGGKTERAQSADEQIKVSEPARAEAPEPIKAEAATPKTAYSADWNLAEFWPGEYPPGFSVLDDGVTLNARATMNPNADKNVACPVPRGATYQPWNGERNMLDKLKFIAATETYKVTMNQDVGLPAYSIASPSEDVILSLKAGDHVKSLIYIGEGYALYEHGGREYQIDQQDLREVSDFDTAGADRSQHLWAEIKCNTAKGERAWVRLNEAVEADGVGPTPITGYGESFDLDDAAIETLRDQMAQQEKYDFYASIDNLVDGDAVTSPLILTGIAPEDWFFENDFPVRLMVSGEEIAGAIANPDANWSDPGHKPFKATLEFEITEQTPAILVLQQDPIFRDNKPRETRVDLMLIPSD